MFRFTTRARNFAPTSPGMPQRPIRYIQTYEVIKWTGTWFWPGLRCHLCDIRETDQRLCIQSVLTCSHLTFTNSSSDIPFTLHLPSSAHLDSGEVHGTVDREDHTAARSANHQSRGPVSATPSNDPLITLTASQAINTSPVTPTALQTTLLSPP
jgi:hypothetical protein